MKIVLIVAVAKHNNGIGKNNDLLWHLPADMAFFKKTTSGFPIITGRKNYESIPERFRPLPNRDNIVITRQNIKYEGAHVVNSIEEAIKMAKKFNTDKAFLIGGGQIYKQALEEGLVDELLITWVDAHLEADVFFPKLNDKWVIDSLEEHLADEKNKYNYTFTKYIKKDS